MTNVSTPCATSSETDILWSFLLSFACPELRAPIRPPAPCMAVEARKTPSFNLVHDANPYTMWVVHVRRGPPSWTASYSYTTQTNHMWLLNANVKCYWFNFSYYQLYIYIRITRWINGKGVVCRGLDINCRWVIYLPATLTEELLVANVTLTYKTSHS